MSEFIWNAWHVGALSRELGPQVLFPRRLLDRPVLFYRTASGEPVAMLDRCPHRFAYLSKGRRVGDEIECVYHGLRFAPDGRCTRSPYQDAPPAGAAVETFPVVERDLGTAGEHALHHGRRSGRHGSRQLGAILHGAEPLHHA